MKRPQAKTIRAVIEHLEAMGLEVMGPNVDPASGIEYYGNRCFTADEVVKYRRLYEADQITSLDEE